MLQPKKYNTGNPVKDRLLRRADSIKQVAQQPKVYIKPTESVTVSTAAEREARKIANAERLAPIEAKQKAGIQSWIDANPGSTVEDYWKMEKKRQSGPDIPLDGMSKIGKDGEGCAGSAGENKRRIKRDAKLAYGSGDMGVGNNYIPSPAETLADYNIMLGKVEAKALSNPWLPAVTAIGGVMSMAAGAANNMAMKTNMEPKEAAAGNPNVQADVEIEGGEVLEDPQGNVEVAQGPSHPKGGIPLEMTEEPAGEGEIQRGTIVSSNRIKGSDGLTMAQRKINRTLLKEKYEKKLATADQPTSNGLKRKLEFLEKEEKEDNDFQGFINNLKQASETVMAAFGTGEEGVQKMWTGGVPQTEEEIRAFQKTNGLVVDGIFGPKSSDKYNMLNGGVSQLKPIAEPIKFTTSSVMDPITKVITKTPLNTLGTNSPLPSGEFAVGPEETIAEDTFDPGYLPKMGDIVALAGQYVSGTTGSKLAAEQRSTDVAFKNEFANVGKESLKNIDQAMGLISQQEAAAKVSATSTLRGGKRNARNSARGVNQLRAVDWLYDTQQQQAMAEITNQSTGQKVGQINKKADVNLQSDVYKGQGAQTAADKNAAAKDAYYTALAKGEMDKGTAMQNAGKSLNQIAMNPLMEKLLAGMGDYITMDGKGNIIKKV